MLRKLDMYVLGRMDALTKYAHEEWGITRDALLMILFFIWAGVNFTLTYYDVRIINDVPVGGIDWTTYLVFAIIGFCMFIEASAFKRNPKLNNARNMVLRTTPMFVILRGIQLLSLALFWTPPVIYNQGPLLWVLNFLDCLLFAVMFYSLHTIGVEDPPGKRFTKPAHNFR